VFGGADLAEFCLDCMNKLDGTCEDSKKYILSKELNLCEECGEYKHTVICERKYHYLHKFRFILIPCYIMWRIIMLPYLIYKYKKDR